MRLFISVASDRAYFSALVWNDWSPSNFRFRPGAGTLSSSHVSLLAVGWWLWLLYSWVLTRIFASGVIALKPVVLLFLVGCISCANTSSTLCSLDGSTLCCVGGVSLDYALAGPYMCRLLQYCQTRNWSLCIRSTTLPVYGLALHMSGVV